MVACLIYLELKLDKMFFIKDIFRLPPNLWPKWTIDYAATARSGFVNISGWMVESLKDLFLVVSLLNIL